MARLACIEIDLVMGILWKAFENAVATSAELQWLGDFRYLKEVTVTRAIEILLAVCCMLGGGLFLITRQRHSSHQCYLVDFACYKPPAERQVNTELSIYFSGMQEPINADNANFQWRIYRRSGLGEETCLPRCYFNDEMVATLEEARVEMEECMVTVLDELFRKTCVEPWEIDIVIVNVSTFGPAPSLTAWIVNRYKMKENVKTFNLSGMGCSASLTAVDMAKDLFKVYRNSYALVIGSENITANGHYEGNNKSMMVTKCLFRVGGYALLLSNKGNDAARAKMRLLHAVRTNVAAMDEAYDCVMVKEDDQGISGVFLGPSLMDVAGDAVRKNMATLGPKVLPITEQLYYAYNMICIKALKMNLTPYIPNFRLAFQHFCVHPGGCWNINSNCTAAGGRGQPTQPARCTRNRQNETTLLFAPPLAKGCIRRRGSEHIHLPPRVPCTSTEKPLSPDGKGRAGCGRVVCELRWIGSTGSDLREAARSLMSGRDEWGGDTWHRSDVSRPPPASNQFSLSFSLVDCRR